MLNKEKKEEDNEYNNYENIKDIKEKQLQAINEIVNYLPFEDYERLKIYNQNIVPILLSIIQSSNDQIALQNAASILGDLSLHTKNKNRMFQDIVGSILHLIESTDPITQEKGMITITNLLVDSDPTLQKKFFYSNSLQIISKFLHNINEKTSIIAIEKCVDLILIVINSRATGKKKALYEANITPELIKLLSHSNKIIQKKITTIFFSLSISFSIRQSLVDENSKNILLNLLKSSFHCNDPSDIYIQSNVLGIFKNVASVPANIPSLTSDGQLLNYINQILDLKSEQILSSNGYSNLIQKLMMLISILSEDSEVKQQLLNLPQFRSKVAHFLFDGYSNFEAKFQTSLALLFLHLPNLVTIIFISSSSLIYILF